jgi:hypothetical protein
LSSLGTDSPTVATASTNNDSSDEPANKNSGHKPDIDAGNDNNKRFSFKKIVSLEVKADLTEAKNTVKRATMRAKFIAYIAAVVSPRVVLLQLIPYCTLWSLVAVELSVCPIFVLSETMRKKLPPFINRGAWEQAVQRLPDLMPTTEEQNGKINLPIWKVIALASYLFLHQSRWISFFQISLQMMVSLGLVFFPHTQLLQFLMSSMLLWVTIMGVANAGYNVILFDKFLHPNDKDDIQNKDGKQEKEAGQKTNNHRLADSTRSKQARNGGDSFLEGGD